MSQLLVTGTFVVRVNEHEIVLVHRRKFYNGSEHVCRLVRD